LDGQVAVFFVMVIAAAESAVGLAIILSVFRSVASVETSDAAELKW
jgi:NADH-quinone oxidoreductase subunit K